MTGRFEIDTQSGLLVGANYIPSPNQDDRPPDCTPELIVIHCISLPPGHFDGDHVARLFLNELDPDLHPDYAEIIAAKVSAHIFIRRGGEIVQFVPFHRRAWHAGQSTYAGRPNCNDYSLGIELEGIDTAPFTADQYTVLGQLIHSLCTAYPTLSSDRITGHNAIAPGRKTDPGDSFEWALLSNIIRNESPNA